MPLGWIFVNIVLPVALPPICILLMKIVTPERIRKISAGNYSLMMLVKDGQLGWSAVGMCAAALYDFFEAVELLGIGGIPSHWGGLFTALLFSLGGAVFVASSGSVYTTEFISDALPFKKWVSHYSLFVFSVIVVLSSAIIFTIIHTTVLPESKKPSANQNHFAGWHQ